MSRVVDPTLPKDQEGAIALMAILAEKDKDETKCFYPTCDDSRKPYDGTGQPPKYCTKHNARNSYDARKYLRDLINGVSAEVAGREPVLFTRATTETQSTALFNAMQHLERLLIQIRSEAQEWSDPTFLDAQIEAIRAQADARVAEIQEKERGEHERRIAAERAKEAALRTAETAQEATDLAINQQEETEAKNQQLREETGRQLAEKQAACDREIAAFRIEMDREIEAIQNQANTQVSEAQAALQQVQKETEQIKEQARQAEEQARIQTASAERLVQSMQEERDRERLEVGRLRKENDGLTQRLDEERLEARKTLEATRTELRQALAQEREEQHTLKDDLKREREVRQLAEKRSDTLATQADTLRERLTVLLQAAQQPPTNPESGGE